MNVFDYIVFVAALLLESVILWRGLRERLWPHYPFFYAYLGYLFVHDAFLLSLVIVLGFDSPAYVLAYWLSDSVTVVLRFCVIWEVFRQLFPARSTVRSVGGFAVAMLLLGLAAALFFSPQARVSIVHDFGRKMAMAQAALLALTFLLARYYQCAWGRNMWGVGTGLGVYVSIAVMNNAAVDLASSFFVFFQYIFTLSFMGMLGLWTWALWRYAPNPRADALPAEAAERGLRHWQDAWHNLNAAVRKAAGL